MPAATGNPSPRLRRALPVAPATLAPALEPVYWSLMKEKRCPAVRDPAYLLHVQQHGMTRSWRRKICRWMFQTAREFDLQMDSVANAMHFLDQFLSRTSVDRAALQLMGMVCLWVATKVHEARPILIAEMAIMCERKFSRDDMLDAEQQLATLIQFHFSPPNCFSFARDFMSLLPVKSERDRDACLASVFQLLELALEDVVSVGCDASSLALAAVQLVAESEFGVSSDKLTVETLLQTAGSAIPVALLAKAASLLRNVYYRHSVAADQVAEASIIASPTAVEEIFDYCPASENVKEDCYAADVSVDDLDSSLLADESESLFASDSESPSLRDHLTRSCDDSDDEDECAGAAKRRRFA